MKRTLFGYHEFRLSLDMPLLHRKENRIERAGDRHAGHAADHQP